MIKRRTTWLIIGLMSAALIGISGIQMYWLRYSINLNEKKFDQSVYSALNDVAGKLQQEEEKYANSFRSTPSGSYLPGNLGIGRLSDIKKKELARKSPEQGDTTRNWFEISGTELQSMREYNLRKFNVRELQERINLELLDRQIAMELENRNINTRYSYGVYSRQDGCYVIRDGHFTACAGSEEATTYLELDPEDYSNLSDSRYRVKLFTGDYGSPGELVIYFPSRRSLIWKDALKTLVWSVLFMGIILVCFAYTLNVIFRQKKLSEMKNDFINNMTHEFKTPIATISLAVDSMTSPRIAGDTEKVSRFASIIKQENTRMLSQVEKVLQMALIDRENLQMKVAEVDVHELIRSAVTNFSIIVQKRGGELDLELRAEEHMIEADPTHLSNIIHNLLDNANKYSPDKPEILVHTENRPNGIAISVRDEGVGMNKEELKHIFDKFYRVHTGNLHDVKGFGLGLSYVKAMVTAHNGHVEVESEPGKGSRFTLFFPFRQSN